MRPGQSRHALGVGDRIGAHRATQRLEVAGPFELQLPGPAEGGPATVAQGRAGRQLLEQVAQQAQCLGQIGGVAVCQVLLRVCVGEGQPLVVAVGGPEPDRFAGAGDRLVRRVRIPHARGQVLQCHPEGAHKDRPLLRVGGEGDGLAEQLDRFPQRVEVVEVQGPFAQCGGQVVQQPWSLMISRGRGRQRLAIALDRLGEQVTVAGGLELAAWWPAPRPRSSS